MRELLGVLVATGVELKDGFYMWQCKSYREVLDSR